MAGRRERGRHAARACRGSAATTSTRLILDLALDRAAAGRAPRRRATGCSRSAASRRRASAPTRAAGGRPRRALGRRRRWSSAWTTSTTACAAAHRADDRGHGRGHARPAARARTAVGWTRAGGDLRRRRGEQLPARLPAAARDASGRTACAARRIRFAATAIGLAIALDDGGRLQLSDALHPPLRRLARGGAGARDRLRPALRQGHAAARATAEPPLTRVRRYRPAHNLGHYRFVECGGLARRAEPDGDLTPWDEIHFPFDPALEGEADLKGVPVARAPLGEGVVEEIYSCDRNGIIAVEIVNHATGARRSYRLRGKR